VITLLHRLLPVVEVRGTHPLAILGGGDQQDAFSSRATPPSSSTATDRVSAGRGPPTAPARLRICGSRSDGRHGAERLISNFSTRRRSGWVDWRVSAKRFSIVLKPVAMHHSNAAKSACRPSSCQRFSAGKQIQFGENIAEPGGEHFLALQRAAQ
jgi:hypothetical protein